MCWKVFWSEEEGERKTKRRREEDLELELLLLLLLPFACPASSEVDWVEVVAEEALESKPIVGLIQSAFGAKGSNKREEEGS